MGETGIVMQNPMQVLEYALAFMFVIISLTAACWASICTLIQLTMDWESVGNMDFAFLLTGTTLVLMANYGVPAFVGHFDMPTGVITWAIANTLWFLYDAAFGE